MLAVLILSVGLLIFGSDATINEAVGAAQHTDPKYSMPAAFNNFNNDNLIALNNPLEIHSQAATNPQNGANCPNSAILLNILNILTNALPQDNNSVLNPAKFKYVLTVVMNFLKTTPLTQENLELYNKFNNLEEQMAKINALVMKPNLRELENNLKAIISLQYELPTQQKQNCYGIFNNLINFINNAYFQVLKHCLLTEQCNANNGMNPPSNYNGIKQFNPYAPIQRYSTTNNWPAHENLAKESITAGTDLVNFIKSQEGKGVNDIMSILKNYRPSGVTNVPANDPKNQNGIHNPLLYPQIPENNQITSLYPSINGINGQSPNLQPSNIYKSPNVNTVPWQTIFSGVKGLTGNTYENQQYVKLLKKFYEEKNLGATSSFYTGAETPLQSINGQNGPMNTGISLTDPKEIVQNNPNAVYDSFKQIPNEQQNSFNTNNKISQAEINKESNYVDSTRLANTQQYLEQLQNLKIQQNIIPNILSLKPILPQQRLSNYNNYGRNQLLNSYLINQSTLGNDQLLNQNGVAFSPFINNAKYYNGQNMFTDNGNQGKYGGQLFNINHLLGVANQGKLNSVPIKNGIVELTYLLKRPQAVLEPQYYVTYRLPYQTFLYNLQNLLVNKPNLRNEPSKLYQDLLVGSNVTDTSKDLKGLQYDDILKLTSTNGTLVTAKLLNNNDTTADQTLKLIQKLNSKLPAESLINFNINATKYIRMESQNNNDNGQNSSDINNLLKSETTNFDVQRKLYSNLNFPYASIAQYPPKLQNNPYSVDKPGLVNVGWPFLKYGNLLPNTNTLQNPALYSPYQTRNYHQFGR